MLSHLGAGTGGSGHRPAAARLAVLPASAALFVSPCHRLRDGALAGAELTQEAGAGAPDAVGQAWLLRAACREAAAWEAIRPPSSGLDVTVSLPPRSARRGLLAQVEAALLGANLVGPELTVALAQADLADAGPDLLLLVAALRDLGANVALDSDAHAGAFERVLRRVPLNALRLHPVLVGRAEEDPDARATLSRVIRLAHAMDTLAVALGVDTALQRDILADLDCDAAQGRLFGRFLPGPVFRAGWKQGCGSAPDPVVRRTPARDGAVPRPHFVKVR